MTLDELKQGETARVCAVTGKGALRRRMLEMGLVQGTQVTVTGAALFGDPIRLRLRGYAVCLRKTDAKMVHITGGNNGEDAGAYR